jgi:hypothetical protein
MMCVGGVNVLRGPQKQALKGVNSHNSLKGEDCNSVGDADVRSVESSRALDTDVDNKYNMTH